MGATAGGGYEKSNNKTQFNYLGEANGFSPGEELMKYLTMSVLQGKALGDNMLGGRSYADKYKGGTFGADIEGAMKQVVQPQAPPATTGDEDPATPPPGTTPPTTPPVDVATGKPPTKGTPGPEVPTSTATAPGKAAPAAKSMSQQTNPFTKGSKEWQDWNVKRNQEFAAQKLTESTTAPSAQQAAAEKEAARAQAARQGIQFNEVNYDNGVKAAELERTMIAKGMDPTQGGLPRDEIASALSSGVPLDQIQKHYETLMATAGPKFNSVGHGQLARLDADAMKAGTWTQTALANAKGGGFAPDAGKAGAATTAAPQSSAAAPQSLANYSEAAQAKPAVQAKPAAAAAKPAQTYPASPLSYDSLAQQIKPQAEPGPANPGDPADSIMGLEGTGGYRPPVFTGQDMPTTGQGLTKQPPVTGGMKPAVQPGLGLEKIGAAAAAGNPSKLGAAPPSKSGAQMGIGMPAPEMSGGMTMQIPAQPEAGMKAGASAVAPTDGGGMVSTGGSDSQDQRQKPDGGGPPEDDPDWVPTVPPPAPNYDAFKFDYGAGVGDDFTAPTGGIYGQYQGMMNAKDGFDAKTRSALTTGAASATQKQAEATRGAMRRRVAATGNDTGFFGGMAQTGRDQSANLTGALQNATLADYAEKTRKNDAGTKGMTDLYNQQQAYTMDLMKMLGNLGGRQREVYNNGATTSANFSVVV